jgi:hypothetical protein
MGEPLYEEVTGRDKLNRPCRVYAPVGTHETLLAYLVRRLLENGANTSFVNRIADKTIAIKDLVQADPVDEASKLVPLGAPHAKIPLPRNLYGSGARQFDGLDLSNEHRLASLSSALLASAHHPWRAAPMLEDNEIAVGHRARCAQSGRSSRSRRHGGRSHIGASERRCRMPSPPRRSGNRRRSMHAPIASPVQPICSKRRCIR